MKMTTETENKKINLVLDATMLDMFQLCPARFHYRFNLNKALPDKTPALDKGSLIHTGLEIYYKELQAGISYEERLEKSIESIKQAIVNESDLPVEEAARCVEVFIEHCANWQDTDERMTIKSVENSFMYILYEDNDLKIILIGKIDLLADYNDGRSNYTDLVIDHKTYNSDFPLKRRTNQFCNYAYATSSNYVLVNRIGFQKTIKPEIKMKRQILSYDPVYLNQWRDNIVIVCKQYLECVRTGIWPMNLTSCDKFNRLCEYDSICDSSGEEAKIWKLQSQYVDVEKWDVSKSLGKKS